MKVSMNAFCLPLSFAGWLRASLCLAAAPAGGRSSVHAAEQPITPKSTIVLFNGKDLTTFYTWVPASGRHQDPDRVFTVVDQIAGAPAIRASGQHYGGFITKSE